MISQVYDDYVAVAFAPRPEMRNADMYFCTRLGLHTGEIQDRYSPPEPSTLPNVGTIYCNLRSFLTYFFTLII